MTANLGRILEFRLEPDGHRTVRIGCDPKAAPAPGRYLLADLPADLDSLLAAALFSSLSFPDGFLAAPLDGPLPPAWELGAELRLRGPLGRGFNLPPAVRNLALAAAGDTAARLLPLVERAGSAALFTDLPVPDLPTRVEVQPLAALPEALGWADFVAVDIPLGRVEDLGGILGEPAALPVTLPAGQVLVHGPMPCGGLGECGLCALPAGRRSILLCVEGPVCDLRLILQR
ncbi:MAG TPA: hypothetical protein VMN57_08730 [Anaerolineales bacterium]|nr:hypothetical protein [Anaerolineales bacterium]